MLSNLGISLLLALGSGGWIYAKMMRHSGNNRKNSIVVASVVAILIIIIITSVLDTVIKKH